MALKISKQLNSGVVATYLRFKECTNAMLVNGEEYPSNKSNLTIQFWLNKQTRELAKAGGNQIPLMENNIVTNTIFADVESTYEYLKTLGEEISDNVIEDC